MSELVSNERYTLDSTASDHNLIGNSYALPEECAIPGYWESVASNSNDWALQISVSPLWQSVKNNLHNWSKEYRRSCGESLMKEAALPSFVGKSAERTKEKILTRLAKSSDGAAEVAHIFDQVVPIPKIEDLVRVRLETKFLDGVPFLAKRILDVAKTFDPNAALTPKGNLNGYFAQHVTFSWLVHYRFAATVRECNVICEVQIATTLATLMWENSHSLYERTRTQDERSEDWQWSPSDPRFLARQLGHMIHLADGLFCNLRDSGKSTKGK